MERGNVKNRKLEIQHAVADLEASTARLREALACDRPVHLDESLADMETDAWWVARLVRKHAKTAGVLVLLLALASCSFGGPDTVGLVSAPDCGTSNVVTDAPPDTPPDAPAPCNPTPPTTYVDPAGVHTNVTIQYPTNYASSCATPRPLFVFFGGYGSDTGYGRQQKMGMKDLRLVGSGALVLAPDGLIQPGTPSTHYWNASRGCCDKLAVGNDDEAYVSGLLDWAVANWNVDRRYVVLLGASNGGFMTERMRCRRPDVVTHVVDMAGAGQATGDPSCAAGPHVFQLVDHSLADTGIAYNGGTWTVMPTPYPAVITTLSQNGCTSFVATTTNAFDHDANTAGAETDRLVCDNGDEHWREPSSAHVFLQTTTTGIITTIWGADVWAWVMGHPR